MKRVLVAIAILVLSAAPAALAGAQVPPLPQPILSIIGPVTSPVCGTAEMYLDLVPVLVQNLPPLVLSLIFGLPFEACGAITPVAPTSPTNATIPPRPKPAPETAPAAEPTPVTFPSAGPMAAPTVDSETSPPSVTVAPTITPPISVPRVQAAPIVSRVVKGGHYGLIWAVPLALLALGWLVGTAATKDLTSTTERSKGTR